MHHVVGLVDQRKRRLKGLGSDARDGACVRHDAPPFVQRLRMIAVEVGGGSAPRDDRDNRQEQGGAGALFRGGLGQLRRGAAVPVGVWDRGDSVGWTGLCESEEFGTGLEGVLNERRKAFAKGGELRPFPKLRESPPLRMLRASFHPLHDRRRQGDLERKFRNVSTH
jgi:hypothetical protein